MTSTLKVVAIPTKVAELARSTMLSPGYGHPAHREVAKGYGPCLIAILFSPPGY